MTRSVRWWVPPWSLGTGTWRVVVRRDRFVLIRYTRELFLCSAVGEAFRCPDVDGQVSQLQLAHHSRRFEVKRRLKSEGKAVPPHASGVDLAQLFPELCSWFIDPTFEDGTPRVGGWVGINAERGTWRMLLKDKAENLELMIADTTLSGLLELANQSLLDEVAPWRPIAFPQGSGKGRKK